MKNALLGLLGPSTVYAGYHFFPRVENKSEALQSHEQQIEVKAEPPLKKKSQLWFECDTKVSNLAKHILEESDLQKFALVSPFFASKTYSVDI